MSAANNSTPNGKKKRRISFSPLGFILFLSIFLAAIGYLSWQAGYLTAFLPAPTTTKTPPEATPSAIPDSTEELTPSPTIQAEAPQALPALADGSLPGMIYLSITEAGYSHLFAYHPETLPLTRLTYGAWEDRFPAVSPDGTQVAFSSNRDGQWDIYLLTLADGTLTQVTNDLAFDGHPAWSSDGLWLAYEKYVGGNLDIYIKPTIEGIDEVRVTSHPAQDFAPAWQPDSTLLAFTSTRANTQDIFLLDTAAPEGTNAAPVNYTNNNTANQHTPRWSPDGLLAWTSPFQGEDTLYLSGYPEAEAASAQRMLTGSEAQWDPSGTYLLSIQRTPDQNFLAIQAAEDRHFALLPTLIEGQINEAAWGENSFPSSLPASLATAARAEPQTPWLDRLIPSTGALFGRQNLIDLPDITAPHAGLNALAVEPFYALKDRTNQALGWDLLSDLENMFVSISQPLLPDEANNWLYTGRAFSLNPILIDYEYMVVVREDYLHETYWRIFIKPLDQSGAQGMPLTEFPWDFDARFSGSVTAYEQGGQPYNEVPGGYWVDFTSLALQYGWERQPALYNWRGYYQGTRYNIFVITSGLTWEQAMLQVWPPEILP